ncbi:hypothetical protein [Xanthomonas campestris]|uniref:hypothetical protein n=1 Tax=Xanthomonas campestris TaxID=339 RepID=UPI0003659167|nr:hypothetical protein [Xanthomonas campestris]MEA0930743.1 hypothetical protein [Xanthomonas campestris pv. campestris]MEB1561347.1 hypothetical protein [Xanthomonas campestris pv. campestris]MEB1717254.1 hypothetical protein [Xanthomonas campestris pv. campestris]MEB1746935.1 hypothetical protein [Xanthomonas campestris pv. campestris]MEB1868510.1 hypothetical protein [Xanthomonas campestris pv. campestris]
MPAKFNQILILDSIPVGQLNTAKRLEDDLRILVAVAAGGGPAVVYQRIESAQAFVAIIAQCNELARRDSYVPLVHLECHGSEEGLKFADGTALEWLAVKNALTPLNLATRLNLIFVISACHGMSMASVVHVTDPAPVYAFIGPSRAMGAQELLEGFLAFYEAYLRTGESTKAIEALRQTAEQGAFAVLSSEAIFRLVLTSHREHYCNPESLAGRARFLQKEALILGRHIDLDETVGLLNSRDWDERFRRTFFMIDQYPEHDERFPLHG